MNRAFSQIKYGNFAERPKPITNEVLSNLAIDFAEGQDVLENKSLKELEKLEDEVEEDSLEVYRRRRLEELKRKRDAYKFGEVVHISKDEYVCEVTDASKSSPDQHVVIHLYSESRPVCEILNRAFAIVASRHGNVKFCKAIGADVIPNFPESRVPTVLVYKNGECKQQFLGGSIWGGLKATADCIEWVLWKNDVVPSASTEEDPRPNRHASESTRGSRAVRYDAEKETGDSDNSSDEERNADRRGYSSLAMEKALRLK